MVQQIQQLQRKPWVAHLLRANTRFDTRLGAQFAAAITYFSVLSLVPIISFAFATAGFVVTRSPDLQQLVDQQIRGVLAGAPMAEQLTGVVLNAFENWLGVGIFAVLAGAYSGAAWIGNIKSAIRAQMRPTFDVVEQKQNLIVETLINLGMLMIFLTILAVTFGLSQVATSLTTVVIQALGLADVPYIEVLFRGVPVVASLLAGFVLFQFIFRAFPEYRAPRSAIAKGAAAGAVGLAILQYLLGFLLSIFGNSPTAALFGPVIALMLFFNLFAQLILRLAGWIATANQLAVAGDESVADRPLHDQDDELLTPRRYAAAIGEDENVDQRANRRGPTDPYTQWTPPEHPEPVKLDEPDDEPVSREVAARGVRVGIAGGWVLGLGTGVGLGAVIAAIASRRSRR